MNKALEKSNYLKSISLTVPFIKPLGQGEFIQEVELETGHVLELVTPLNIFLVQFPCDPGFECDLWFGRN